MVTIQQMLIIEYRPGTNSPNCSMSLSSWLKSSHFRASTEGGHLTAIEAAHTSYEMQNESGLSVLSEKDT